MENVSYFEECKPVNFLAWLAGQHGYPESFYFGKPVHPSDVFDDSGPRDTVRTVIAESFTIETNLLLQDCGDCYVAYPTSTTKVIHLPGYREPINVIWEVNQKQAGVVHVLRIEDFPPIPVFLGEFQDFETLSPDPKRTSLWERKPLPKEETLVRIGYNFSFRDRKLIAKAFPAKEKDFYGIEDAKLYSFDGNSIFVPGPDTRVLSVNEENGIITIRFTPK